jgi:hypothetical protein
MTQLIAYREAQDKAVMVLIQETIPAKILELDAMIHSLDTTKWKEEEQFSFTRETLQPEFLRSLHVLNDIEVFLKRCLPKMEEGHNSGVDIIKAVGIEIAIFSQRISKLEPELVNVFWGAGVTDTKSKKHALSEDYQRSYILRVEKRNSLIVLNLKDIRDAYDMSHDVVSKNLDVILCPRKVQASNMY